MAIRRICVFCGSRPGTRPEYLACATATGRLLAERGIGLVYGGASVGTMGAVADAALAAGGEVIGVMPRGMIARELAHTGLTRLHEVDTMHARKALMIDLADGFMALPGGGGTLDEFFEVFTLAQLRLHDKPCALIDVAGYYQTLMTFLQQSVTAGFVPAEHLQMIAVVPEPEQALDLWLDELPED